MTRTRPRSAPPVPRRASRVARLAAALCSTTLVAGCAAPGSDVHLAPIVTRLATADGASEVEAFGGMIYQRREIRPVLLGPGELSGRALRPLWGWRRIDAERERVDFLVPFGFWKRDRGNVNSLLFPLYYYRSAPAGWREGEPGTAEAEGVAGEREFDLLALPGIFWSKNRRGAHKLGWFPFYGQLNDFATYDRVTFVLFPLYATLKRGEDVLQNVLFPVFGWKSSGYRSHWRVWPLVGYKHKAGSFRRGFFLWPIFLWGTERLSEPREQQRRTWMFWPLIGHQRDRTYRSWTFLWPFFGFAHDPRGADEGGEAYRAFDAPWPIVRVQRGGANPRAEERVRLWPVFSWFRGDGLRWWTAAWPIVHRRLEDTPTYDRASFYVFPIYQQWDLERRDPDEEYPSIERWRRVWPLYRYERLGDARRLAFPSLSPLARNSSFDFYYGWLWELYSLEREGARSKHRSWMGLFRREADAYEQRSSLAGLWSQRRYDDGLGTVRETSLLFGLVRWRSGHPEADRGFLPPAFPGPGWPREWARPPGTPAPRPSPFANGVPR